MGLPDWAEKQRKPGVEIREQRGQVYAYRVGSRYDPKAKRSRKITQEYLGKVTPDGIVPSKSRRRPKIQPILEAGNIQLLKRLAAPLEEALKPYWPRQWQTIIAAAALRMAYRCSLTNIAFHHDTSTSHHAWPDAHVSPDSMTRLLNDLGLDHGRIVEFYRSLHEEGAHLAVDLTHVMSDSRGIRWIERGYAGRGEPTRDVFQLFLVWNVRAHAPGFLKLLPGTVNSAAGLVDSVRESGLKDVVAVGDEGFYSAANLGSLEHAGVSYVVRAPRTQAFIPKLPESRFKQYVSWRKRPQWYVETRILVVDDDGTRRDRRVVVFLDKQIRARQEAAFLDAVDEGRKHLKDLDAARACFGVMGLITDTELSPQELWELYQGRAEIEEAFRALKGTLGADRSWMQSLESLHGFYFILFLSLWLYSRVQQHLKRKRLTKKYSVHDILLRLSKLHQVQAGGEVWPVEPTKQTRDLAKALEVSLTETSGN